MTDRWLEEYMHDGPHEYFFSEFLIILNEWLTWLTYPKKHFQGGETMSWTPKLIQNLLEVDNRESRAIEFWIDSILEGYITEFVADTTKSYSEA